MLYTYMLHLYFFKHLYLSFSYTYIYILIYIGYNIYTIYIAYYIHYIVCYIYSSIQLKGINTVLAKMFADKKSMKFTRFYHLLTTF